jgi:hypothetical protein
MMYIFQSFFNEYLYFVVIFYSRFGNHKYGDYFYISINNPLMGSINEME